MRCIRLTKCARDKLDIVKEWFLNIIIIIGILIVVVAGITTLVFLLGLIAQAIAVAFTGTLTFIGIDIMDAGAAGIGIIIITGTLLFIIYLGFRLIWTASKAMYATGKSVGQAALGIKPFECAIFEWCD